MYLFISFIPKAAKSLHIIFMKNANEDFGITNKVELAYILKMACFPLITFIAITLKVLLWLEGQWVCTEAAEEFFLSLGQILMLCFIVLFCSVRPLWNTPWFVTSLARALGVLLIYMVGGWVDVPEGIWLIQSEGGSSIGFSQGGIRLLWEYLPFF